MFGCLFIDINNYKHNIWQTIICLQCFNNVADILYDVCAHRLGNM